MKMKYKDVPINYTFCLMNRRENSYKYKKISDTHSIVVAHTFKEKEDTIIADKYVKESYKISMLPYFECIVISSDKKPRYRYIDEDESKIEEKSETKMIEEKTIEPIFFMNGGYSTIKINPSLISSSLDDDEDDDDDDFYEATT